MTSILQEFKIFNYLPKTIKYEIKCFYVTSDSEFAYCVTNKDQVYGVGKDVRKIFNYQGGSDQDNYAEIKELLKKNIIEFFEDKNHHGMFARTGDNQVYGWGSNRFGLFKGDQDYCEPQIVELFQNKNIVQIGFGQNYYLALSSDNNIYGQGTIVEEWRRLKEIYDEPDNNEFEYFYETFELEQMLASSIIKEQIKSIYCFTRMTFVVTIEGQVYCSSVGGWRRIPKLNNVCKVQMGENLVIFLRKNGLILMWDDHERKWMEYYIDVNITDICVIRKGNWRHQVVFEENGLVCRFRGQYLVGPDPFDIRKTDYKSIFEYNLFNNQVTHQTIYVKQNSIEYQGAIETKIISVEEFIKNNKQNLNIRKELKNFRVFNAFPKNVRTGVKCFYQSGDYSSDKYLAFYVTNDNHVYCLGNNDRGKLGLGHSDRVENYSEIPQLYNQGIEEFLDGGDCMFARNNSNKIFGWGVNLFGKLLTSDPVTFVKPAPLLIGDENTEIVYIEKCELGTFCLALTANGQVFGWGRNDFMQICHDDKESISEPVQILFNNVNQPFIKYIHCFFETAFAVTIDGKVFVWGAPTCGIEQGPKLLDIENVVKVVSQKCAWLFLNEDKSVVIFDTKIELYRLINCSTKVNDIYIHVNSSTSGLSWNTTVLQTESNVLELTEQDQIVETQNHNFYDYVLQKFKTTLGNIHIDSQGYIKNKKIFITNNNQGIILAINFENNIYQDKFEKHFKIDDKTYYDQGLLGKGGFGKVFRVLSTNNRDKMYAIKQIDLKDALSILGDINYIFEEIRVMTKVKSEFVVDYIDSWLETKFETKGFTKYVYIHRIL